MATSAPAPIKQQSRSIAIATLLGEDVLGLRSFALHEKISRPFQIDVELSSNESKVDFNSIVGHNVTIRLNLARGAVRYFNGFVNRFAQVPNEGSFFHYRATIVPWLWFLTRPTDCRIFQDKSVPEIIEEVFKEKGFGDYRLNLSATYPKKEYCVQYRETDFNFVSRLMEQEGIYYFFVHENGKHTLVLADAISAHNSPQGYAEVPFWEMQKGGAAKEAVTQWVATMELEPVASALCDFDFKKPGSSLLTGLSVGRRHGKAEYEVFDYPGQYTEHEDGERLALVRLDELQTGHAVFHGEATSRGLAAGSVFKMKEHPRGDYNRDYLITGVTLQVDAGEFATSANEPAAREFFSCTLNAIDKAQQFRPARVTPKIIVQGPQTAIVTGPAGEEIHTDEHGRVKVQFHWDRRGTYDENSSCWVRVSQYWAGKAWGAMYLPRIGQEVVVEFLEGDPDRPLITGRVYNAEQVPPYKLPDDKTKSTLKSNSSKGGGGSNEFRFEDLKGKEEVFLHGEKDWTIHIKNNESETVGSNISTNAGGNISRNAGANISRTADVTITDMAGKDIVTQSGNNMALKAGGSYELWTNLGIHLKAMNFIAELIESGAKAAAAAIAKGAAGGASGKSGVSGKASGAASGATAAAKTTGLEAMGPAISAVSTDLAARQAQAGQNMETAAEGGEEVGKTAAELHQAVNSNASNEVIAAAAMALASACYDTYKDAKKLIEDMLPQIPSIVLWAMKDINATALWSMSLETKVRDISIEAKNRDVNIKGKQNVSIEAAKKDLKVKAKQNISLEASEKDINIKASKKKVLITAKEEVNVTAEDKNLIIEAKKKKVFVKSADQIFLKCGSASISMAKSGNIVIKGAKINVNGSGPVTVKGNPVKLN